MQNKSHSPAHLKDFTVDVLKNLQAGDVFDRLENTSDAIVTNEMAYFSLNALSKKLGHLHLVVTDGNGRLPIRCEEDLHSALEKLPSSGFDKLRVVAQSAVPQRFLGYLEYGDLLRIYDEEMARVERLE